MTQIKDVKLTSTITEQPITEYVTFWGKLKGDIEKQKDLHDILSAIKRSVNDVSTKLLRKQDRLTPGANITIKQDSEEKLVISGPTNTSELVNDGEGAQDSEGNIDKFTTRSEVTNIADILNAKVEDVEFELNDKIYDLNSEVNTKQDKLAAGDGILLEDNVISISSRTLPGNGKLTINLNGSKLTDFFANQNEDTVANINIQTVPGADHESAGKLLGLNEEGTAYKFYSVPQELPEISDSSYDGKVLTVNDNLEPEWKDPQATAVNSNIFYVDVATQYGMQTTYIKNKTSEEMYNAYMNGNLVIVRYHPNGNIDGNLMYTIPLSFIVYDNVMIFNYFNTDTGSPKFNSINIGVANDSIIVREYN